MKKTPIDNDDLALFRDAMADTRPMAQDTIGHERPRRPKRRQLADQKTAREASFYFSDSYQPHFGENWPNYVREGVSAGELKKLRRGDYAPEMTLDLHGMTRESAKLELVALIDRAIKDQVFCLCIMHGIGTGALKKQVPSWLAQHPKVLAIQSAPREYGGQGALLVLVDSVH